MIKNRLLIDNNTVNFKFFFLNILVCSFITILQVQALSEISIFISIPFCILNFIVMWQLFYSVMLNLKIAFSKTISHDSTELLTDDTLPDVAFIIPSYHEPFEVAKMTFDSVYNLNYNGHKEIIVVDNSVKIDAPDFIKWKAYVNSFINKSSKRSIKFFHNKTKGELKPGNLDLAQKHLGDSEYVVFLDIDSTLPKNLQIIEKSILEFKKDLSLGWIQFYTKSTNHNFSIRARAIGIFQNLLRINTHFRSQGGFTLFYGHNSIWRKSCLLKLGPWFEKHRGQVMITEDILKTIIAYNKGYYGKSLEFDTGEWVPYSLDALETMWLRWTYGTCQVTHKYLSKIIKTKNMTFFEKYDLMHLVVSYWGNAFLYPLVIICQFIMPQTSWIYVLLFCIFPQLIVGTAMFKYYYKDTKVTFSRKLIDLYSSSVIISNFVTAIQLKGAYKYILHMPQGWKVTEKGNKKSTNQNSWYAIFNRYKTYIIISAIMLISSFVSWRIYFDKFSDLIYYFPMIFTSFNIFLSVILYAKSDNLKSFSTTSSTIDNVNKEPIFESELTIPQRVVIKN